MEKARENGILVIAASIITAIRLRGEPIERRPKWLPPSVTQFSWPA
jgi:hypothetical protein